MMPIANQSLYEIPAPTGLVSEEGPYMQDTTSGWTYDTGQEWGLPSPVENHRGLVSSRQENEFKYPSMSSYGMFDSRGDIMDASTVTYTGLAEHNGTNMVTPFESEGLPFAGLEFLHSYNPNGNDPGSLELWNSLGPSAFEYGPEVPFALGEQVGFDE
jgi:hypothetical protein